MREAFSVSGVNAIVKNIIEDNLRLQYLEVRGEIINLKRYPNAVYFTLKEGDVARLSAVSFNPRSFPSSLKDGDEVIASGRLSVYSKSGSYQLIAREVTYFGLGAKLVALATLKKKLEGEGYFAPEKKLKLPRFPRNVGLIVPKDSAAQSDIVTNIARRYPLVTLKVIHATFQGESAPSSLIKAFQTLNKEDLDVMIIARGGGSSDDLWAFNDEGLIRALSAKRVALISAIGHEIDTTLVDYLADVRASTPTAAAELAVPDQNELRQDIINYQTRLDNALEAKYVKLTEQTRLLSSRPVLVNFQSVIETLASRVKELTLRLSGSVRSTINTTDGSLIQSATRINEYMQRFLAQKEQSLTTNSAKLSSLNPRLVLSRGYAFVSRDTTIIKSREDLSIGEKIKIEFSDGALIATVEGVEDEE